MSGYSELTVAQLLAQHSDVLAELRRRGICRSANNPTGDYAEYLVANRLGLTLESNSVKGYDATDSLGIRYQIKGRRRDPGSRPTQLSPIRNLDSRAFDYLVAVMFEPDWSVKLAAKIPYDTVSQIATFKLHVNGHVMHLRTGILARPEVIDITAVLNGALGARALAYKQTP